MCVVIGAPVSRCARCDGAQDAFDAGSHAIVIGGALEDRGLDVGAADAFGDVAHEVVDHLVAAALAHAGHTEVEGERDVVVRVHAGRRHDVQVDLLGDTRHR